MRRFYHYFLLMLLFSLSACAMPIDKGPDLGTLSTQFSDAMRWRDVTGAANLLDEAVREPFIEQFQDDDIHVVESQVVTVLLDETLENAKVEYLMDYYLLPSTRIKKWSWHQQWQLIHNEESRTSLWQIQDAPPAFP